MITFEKGPSTGPCYGLVNSFQPSSIGDTFLSQYGNTFILLTGSGRCLIFSPDVTGNTPFAASVGELTGQYRRVNITIKIEEVG